MSKKQGKSKGRFRHTKKNVLHKKRVNTKKRGLRGGAIDTRAIIDQQGLHGITGNLIPDFVRKTQLSNDVCNEWFNKIHNLDIQTMKKAFTTDGTLKTTSTGRKDYDICSKKLNNDTSIEQLKKRQNRRVIIGGNIGKNKWTPNEAAVEDYLLCFDALFPYVDYFVVNVSSPNTPNLRALQEKEPLQDLLLQIQEKNAAQKVSKPILLKIAPDLNDTQLDEIIEIVNHTKIAGLIVANTTISRAQLLTPKAEVDQMGAGGISGKPITARSTAMIKYIHEKSNGQIPMMAVGGVHSAQDAIDKLDAGASLVQLYTGFIYEGPALVKSINRALQKRAVQ